MLTVGYGDLIPQTVEGKILGGFLMLCGVGTVGIMTARISSYFLEQTFGMGRMRVDTDTLHDHFILCGWKEDMDKLLLHILDCNDELEPDQMVIIANISPALAGPVLDHPRLRGVQFIFGDYSSEVTLRKAAPAKARKVMLLADKAPGPNGQPLTPTEIDAKTIMTAMTLSHIARHTLVAAEVLDPKMDQYLRLAHVAEIIYTREYSRLILGNASRGVGISNIILDLLDPKTSSVITTHAVPEEYLRIDYPTFKDAYEKNNPDIQVIGILENTGNQHRIKEVALSRAQKTPDMKTLVENLKLVKQIQCNLPVFNPPRNYLIQEGMMAIVIEHSNHEVSQVDQNEEVSDSFLKRMTKIQGLNEKRENNTRKRPKGDQSGGESEAA